MADPDRDAVVPDLYDDKVQEGISWTMRQWGETLGLTTWTQGDGSETVEGDVGAEIHTILVDAGLRCPETNLMATLAAPPFPRAAVTFTGRKHDLKCWPEPFAAIRAGLKNWELRLNDRDFQIGDLLWQKEWDPATGEYTGEATGNLVIWMLEGPTFGLPEGYCIMSLDWNPAAGGRA